MSQRLFFSCSPTGRLSIPMDLATWKYISLSSCKALEPQRPISITEPMGKPHQPRVGGREPHRPRSPEVRHFLSHPGGIECHGKRNPLKP